MDKEQFISNNQNLKIALKNQFQNSDLAYSFTEDNMEQLIELALKGVSNWYYVNGNLTDAHIIQAEIN